MNEVLFWLWGPSLLLIAAAVALGAQRWDRRHRHNRKPAE
jgi:hypothetical protein